MAAECKRLLAQRRAQRRAQLEAAVGDSRRLLVEQQVVDLSVCADQELNPVESCGAGNVSKAVKCSGDVTLVRCFKVLWD